MGQNHKNQVHYVYTHILLDTGYHHAKFKDLINTAFKEGVNTDVSVYIEVLCLAKQWILMSHQLHRVTSQCTYTSRSQCTFKSLPMFQGVLKAGLHVWPTHKQGSSQNQPDIQWLVLAQTWELSEPARYPACCKQPLVSTFLRNLHQSLVTKEHSDLS